MKAIRVNGDYEKELFSGKSSGKTNDALEFLAFFLSNKPVFTHKKYSSEYLDHVESLSGHRPQTVHLGSYENWWGKLENLELEKYYNSKLTSFKFALSEGWTSGKVVTHSDLNDFQFTTPHLLKDPFGMSGAGFLRADPPFEIPQFEGERILEPLYMREKDFTHFVLPDGSTICYENRVDRKFHYKGSIIDLSKLSFDFTWKEDISFELINSQVEKIKAFYAPVQHLGYSIDAFAFREEGKLKVHPLSEVNVRRTMGLCAYELTKKFNCQWGMLLLIPSFQERGGFRSLLQKLPHSVHLLSPGDTRFEMLFLTSQNAEEGEKLLNHTQAAVMV